jgi:hypothetical protein
VHVLKEANDEQVRKLRKDSALQSETMMQGQIKDRRLSLAIGKKKAKHRLSMGDVSTFQGITSCGCSCFRS